MKNVELVKKVLENCFRVGIEDFVLCPGGRNAPFVGVLKNINDKINVPTFFDERSAAFYALGIAKAKGRPVAIITTSGTAVPEVYSAVVEAYYTGLSLVVISADRPKKFRHTGAPQSIEQANFFGHYVGLTVDAETVGELSALDSWNGFSSAQINVCFDEPLWGDYKSISLDTTVGSPAIPNVLFQRSYVKLEAWAGDYKKPLIIVGAVDSNDKAALVNWLNNQNAFLLLESSSLLANEKSLHHKIIKSERLARSLVENKVVDSIIRIGHVPSFKLWRELENVFETPVLSINDLPFKGLTRGEFIHSKLSYLFKDSKQLFGELDLSPLEKLNNNEQQCLDHLFETYPYSEQSLVHQLALTIPENALIYLGNSLPIREWNQYGNIGKKNDYLENRGANGIDGQISTFLGALQSHSAPEAWMIVGDLTTLYDMNAFWGLQFSGDKKIRIVVINNGGGRIFERLYQEAFFQNNHQISFEYLAKFWGLEYLKTDNAKFDPTQLASKVLIEVCPDELQSSSFATEWRKR